MLFNVFLQHLSKRYIFRMSIDFFQRLIMSEGTYVHQMSCTRKDFPTKISLKMHFWKDLRGVLKKSFILKDPVEPSKKFSVGGGWVLKATLVFCFGPKILVLA